MKISRLLNAICVCLLAITSGSTWAGYAKFPIPEAFPGNFFIDFLATDFYLNGSSAGGLSNESTIQFSVGSETSLGSGVFNTSVSPDGFIFVGFSAAGLPFDVYGAGTGTGTFDTNSGNWEIDMPTLWVNQSGGGPGGTTAIGTRLDFHLTTNNIFIPSDSFSNQGYMTTTASSMIIDDSNPAWGDMHLVAGGVVPNSSELNNSLYDYDLINSIASTYSNFSLDTNQWEGIQYEFNIYGNDPLASVPVPAAVWLFSSGLLGLIGIARRQKVV